MDSDKVTSGLMKSLEYIWTEGGLDFLLLVGGPRIIFACLSAIVGGKDVPQTIMNY